MLVARPPAAPVRPSAAAPFHPPAAALVARAAAPVRPLTVPARTPLSPRLELDALAATPEARALFTDEAVALLTALHDAFEPVRQHLLSARIAAQGRYDRGYTPAFLPRGSHPAHDRAWTVAPLPADLLTRRVEITGPVSSAKMVVTMLSRTADGHRADTAMLDFEDALKPSWQNVVAGVHNVAAVALGTLEAEENGRRYRLDLADCAHPMVRVRGLHLSETNVRIDGQPVSAGLLDFALVAVHSARTFAGRGVTPTFYVPKTEHYLEARWWNDLFSALEARLGLAHGTVKATFLIETLPAAFQMEEILYEIRDHAAGLNGGRWDKIFSDIKVLREHEDRVVADRATIGMNRPWMADYARLLVRTCHRHGAFGMGGMAAFTPGKTPERRAEQTQKVVQDKEWEASIGCDGCWVSHPYFIGPALSAFPRQNQLDVVPEGDDFPDLLPRKTGPCTLDGLRTNVRVGIAYLDGWKRDVGALAWDDLMEDLATLEISRAQTWQWLRHHVVLDASVGGDGESRGLTVTKDVVSRVFDEELARIQAECRAAGLPEAVCAGFAAAAHEAEALFTERSFRAFLTCVSESEAERAAGVVRLAEHGCY